jgi:type IV pilus assembly protein PilW
VALRAQYGVADAPGGGVAQWVDAQGAWANPDTTLASRIRAVRIGIVVRSAQREKPDAAGQCNATEQAPVLWAGEAVGLADPDWRCWRYRSVVSIVALRNFVTGTTP